MAAVRAMLARVQRLEQARAPTSPFVLAFGSLGAFTDEVRDGIDAGTYDDRDMAVVIAGIERWHRAGVWVAR